MRRLAAILALVLGLTLLAAPPASAAVAAHAENRASGSATAPDNLIGIEAQLSERSVRENIALDYDIASDDAVAARGLSHWGNPKTLARHFRDHGADFGAKSADDYARQASDFFRRSQADRLPTKIDADGVIRVYDPRTNTFGSFNPDGTTRTFFKPTSPTYFDRQPGGAPWGP